MFLKSHASNGVIYLLVVFRARPATRQVHQRAVQLPTRPTGTASSLLIVALSSPPMNGVTLNIRIVCAPSEKMLQCQCPPENLWSSALATFMEFVIHPVGLSTHGQGRSSPSAIGSAEIMLGAADESGSPGTGCQGTSTSLSWSSTFAISSSGLRLRLRARTTPSTVPTWNFELLSTTRKNNPPLQRSGRRSLAN